MAKITNINELDNIKKYFCGSQRLSHNIRTKLGILPIDVYTNKNNKVINVYIMTPQLSQFLNDWTKNNPKKVGEV